MEGLARYPRKSWTLAFVLFLIVFSSISFAQNITLQITGTCKEYNVTITATGFEEACYDVKIEAVSTKASSSIYDPREGWKSSFYYIDEALCNNTGSFQIRADDSETLHFLAKLRLDNNVWQSSYYEVQQSCPETDELFIFAVVLVVILILLVLVTFYVKGSDTKIKKKTKKRR